MLGVYGVVLVVVEGVVMLEMSSLSFHENSSCVFEDYFVWLALSKKQHRKAKA